VIGISVDNTESHAKFAEKHGLPFPLLSDGDTKVAKSYGSLMSLGPIKIAKRHSFIINPEGNIAKVYRDVKPAEHSDEIIRDLKALQKE
jgi:peroxiredoxin Q/BCP